MDAMTDFYTAGVVLIDEVFDNGAAGHDDYETVSETRTHDFDDVVDFLHKRITELLHDHDHRGDIPELDRLRASLPQRPPTDPDPDADDYTSTYTWLGLVWQGLAAGRYWYLLHHPMTAPMDDLGGQRLLERVVDQHLRAEAATAAALRGEVPNPHHQLTLRAAYRQAGVHLPVPPDLEDGG